MRNCNRAASFLAMMRATLMPRVAEPGRLQAQRGPRVTGRLGTRLAAIMVLAACSGGKVPAQAAEVPSREYDTKAALLFNFTRFVEWPADAFPQTDDPAVIGVLGQDPFGSVLDEIVRNEKWAGRKITVQRYRHVEAARHCQILFVTASEEANFPHILRMLRGRPVLTVGDSEVLALRGGMIRLMKSPAGKMSLQINLEAVQASGLTVSAKLLRVAEVVGTPGK